ncbi:hypothetical protein EVAR_72242_1, partial [Eumeta japonica]
MLSIASAPIASTSGLTCSSLTTTNSESEETDSDLTDSTESSHSTSLSDREGVHSWHKFEFQTKRADDYWGEYETAASSPAK